MDLKYKNKEGISLQKVLDVISKNNDISKKDLAKKVKAKKSIDTLINKLIDLEAIHKIKDGRTVFYTTQMDADVVEEVSMVIPIEKSKPSPIKMPSATVTDDITPVTSAVIASVVNEPKEKIPKKHQSVEESTLVLETKETKTVEESTLTVEVDKGIQSLKEASAPIIHTPKQKKTKTEPHRSATLIKPVDPTADVVENTIVMTTDASIKKLTSEINQGDLDHLKSEMEVQSGKNVTAILHTRNEKKPVKEYINVEEIYNNNKIAEAKEAEEATQKKEEELKLVVDGANTKLVSEKITEEIVIDQENPYRFVLNFFTTTLNGEVATPHFKRRDNYVVKSIYNKFKTLCDIIDEYDTNQQHIPFYRAFTIDKYTMTVKMYHIDMNRVIRGYHDLFKISDEDKKFIFEGK